MPSKLRFKKVPVSNNTQVLGLKISSEGKGHASSSYRGLFGNSQWFLMALTWLEMGKISIAINRVPKYYAYWT